MVVMASLEDHERKIVMEFVHLLEKSKQLFNGLRDLPQYGHKQWQAYFGRTFDVYTKLWKFQQQHRQILDTKYGLKRWQIGEIASKIGQLYYHYYLRTSETNYLNEAYSFYAAIRGRAYYSRAAKEDRSELMVKKLRYYARFIVVCLLLRRMKLVRELIIELDRHIADYTSTYEPDDQIEWSLVLDEIKAFIQSDSLVQVLHADTNPIVLSHRLSPLTTPPVEKSPHMNLTLQEILIIGSSSEQVKFSELTMDMFRMIQTLEREPQEDFNHIYDASPAPGRVPYGVPGQKGYIENGDRPLRRENPHKYLLYKPTLSQVLVFLASGFKELPANGALLLYLSADGCFSTTKHPEDMGYDLGGVLTSSRRDGEHKKQKEAHCLYPGDLYPFTRRPLFVIVDSDNSFVFQHIPRYFGQPLVTLMSPQDTPPAFQDQQHNGSLFTLFLHSPLTAFCYCCNLTSIPIHHWERCQSFIDRFVTEASRLFTRSRVGEYDEGMFVDYAIHILHIYNSSVTTSCAFSSSAMYSAMWFSTCTAPSVAVNTVLDVNHLYQRPNSWNTCPYSIWCLISPPTWKSGLTSWTLRKSNDPGLCPLRRLAWGLEDPTTRQQLQDGPHRNAGLLELTPEEKHQHQINIIL